MVIFFPRPSLAGCSRDSYQVAARDLYHAQVVPMCQQRKILQIHTWVLLFGNRAVGRALQAEHDPFDARRKGTIGQIVSKLGVRRVAG